MNLTRSPIKTSRRQLLTGLLAASAMVAGCTGQQDRARTTPTTKAPISRSGPASQPGVGSASFGGSPFSLGVASGDPWPDGVVLWTRLAPEPIKGGGMPAGSVSVRWEVANDEGFRNVVQSGEDTARPESAHSVHVEVSGLEPERWYWYRFKAGADVSAVGRTKTAPPLGSPLNELRFAFISCQNWEYGYFTALNHLSREDLDLVVHLGDYIYESAGRTDRPRAHGTAAPRTLAEYRDRYALYKSDPDLQAAHAAFPWVVTWDDHEVENNYAGLVDTRNSPIELFSKRRAAAYQAYWEHQPLRRASLPVGPDMRLYRRFAYGNLAEFVVLDTRQYRSDQPCGDDLKPRCTVSLSESLSMTGPDQERWLLDTLSASRARWNVVAQQTMMAQVDRMEGDSELFNMDQWDGYPAARSRILQFLHQRRPPNPVVISGDIHSNWVADLKLDFSDKRSPLVGTELVGTSVTSGGDGRPGTNRVYLSENPHIKFFNAQRGYVRSTLTPKLWTADYQVVPFVSNRGAPLQKLATWVIEDGQPGAKRG